MIRKFYDAAASEGTAAPRFEKGEAIPFSEIIAQKEETETPEGETEEKVEGKVEDKVDDKAKLNGEAKGEEKKEEIGVEEKPATHDWKEFVKNPEYRKEVHNLLEIDEEALKLSKELTQDEFVKKLVTYRKENGNLTPFIEAATKDWDKYSHEQLVMDDLKKQYSSLSPDKREKLAKSEFNQRFSYKPDDMLSDEENTELAELASIKLESEGEKIRQARKTEQQQFLDSVKPVDKTAEAQRLAQEQEANARKELEWFRAMYDADPASIKLNADKKIILGKENPFNYSVSPETIKEQTLNTNNFYGKFWSKTDGKEAFNADLWNRVVAYSENPVAFEEALINHGRSLGTKQIVEGELENKKETTDQKTTHTKKSLAKTFAEEGQPITLGELMGG